MTNPKKVLFVGGTGLISSAVTRQAIDQGIDLTLLNRGTHKDDFGSEVRRIHCDINDEEGVKSLLEGKHFDAVVNWIVFTEDQARRDVRLFKGLTDQYVFISSASSYQKPVKTIPIKEDETPLGNPYWRYSQNKEACERYLMSQSTSDFAVTIIRPSHTYDERSVVSQLNSWRHPYTLLNRMKLGKPVILCDQGESLWTLTYNEDFARPFIGVLGNPKTYHQAYHLTSDQVVRWREVHQMLEEALGVTSKVILIPTEEVIKDFEEFAGPLLGDMKDSVTFDNSKIRQVVPFEEMTTSYQMVVSKVVRYYDTHPEVRVIDEDFDRRYDQLIRRYLKSDSSEH